jgi:hypothetical protein
MTGGESANPGTTEDAGPAEPVSWRVKVHPRCVQSHEQLRSTLNMLCNGGYTVEVRHNMYIIKTAKPLDQRQLVAELLGRHGEGPDDKGANSLIRSEFLT